MLSSPAKDRSVTLNTEVVEKPQELIIDEFCDMIKGNEAGNKSAHVESIKILSIENLSDDILFSHSEVEAIQKETSSKTKTRSSASASFFSNSLYNFRSPNS